LRVNGFVNGVESSYVAGERSNNLSGGAVQLGETQRGIRWGSLDGQASTWFDDGQLGGAFYLTEEDISDVMVYVKSQNLKGVTYSAPVSPPAAGGSNRVIDDIIALIADPIIPLIGG